jgi:DNA invertase Pin-like site-specific DNA recombinase
MSSNGTTPPLKFAALVRVSTRKQEREGESLPVQREAIAEAVQALGGSIVDWYGGQEHATPGWERKEFDRLLADAATKKFDAVIISRVDRWSRDNRRSEDGLEVFLRHGTKFYIRTAAQDLHDPTTRFILAMQVEIGRFNARLQNQTAMQSKRKRAREGKPACGRRPWGRTWSPEAGWGLDPDKVQALRSAADRLIAGESLPALAAEMALSPSGLYKVLVRRSGPVWEQTFAAPGGGRDVYPCPVPELLDAETIARVKERLVGNRTFLRGQQKHRYLLSRLVRCHRCGTALTGSCDCGRRIYKHTSASRIKRGAGCPYFAVPADRLEERVLRHLTNTFGDPHAVRDALAAAVPDAARLHADRAELHRVARGLTQCRKELGRLVVAISKGLITDADAKDARDRIEARRGRLSARRAELLAHLAHTKSPEELAESARGVVERFGHTDYAAMSWQSRRDLAVMVFEGGRDDDYGVFVCRVESGDFVYHLRGHLTDGIGAFGPGERMSVPDPTFDERHLVATAALLGDDEYAAAKATVNTAEESPLPSCRRRAPTASRPP